MELEIQPTAVTLYSVTSPSEVLLPSGEATTAPGAMTLYCAVFSMAQLAETQVRRSMHSGRELFCGGIGARAAVGCGADT
jgi:hypothetical protein